MRLITTFNIFRSGAVLTLLWSLPTSVVAQEAAVTQDDTQSQTASPQDKNSREESLQAPPKQDEDSDDTPDVDTESTIDRGEERRGLKIDGDLRPIYENHRKKADRSSLLAGLLVKLYQDHRVRALR